MHLASVIDPCHTKHDRSLRLDEPLLPLLAGWLAIFGWAATIVHGMLTRIVPFLVWFHRFAALAGRAPIPPMRRLLPADRVKPGLWTHAGAVVLGAAAMLSGQGWLLQLAGALLAVSGGVLGVGLLRVYRVPVPVVAEPPGTAYD